MGRKQVRPSWSNEWFEILDERQATQYLIQRGLITSWESDVDIREVSERMHRAIYTNGDVDESWFPEEAKDDESEVIGYLYQKDGLFWTEMS